MSTSESLVLGPAALHDPRAKALWEGPVVRGLQRSIIERRASFAIEFEQSIREFEERDPDGRVIGKSRARKISKERLDQTVERIVRGLYWWEYDGHRPGANVRFKIEIGRVRDLDPERLAQRLMHSDATIRSVAGGIFQYWFYAEEGDPIFSTWLLTFYRAIAFLIHSVPMRR
jgi:hypothetical protein